MITEPALTNDFLRDFLRRIYDLDAAHIAFVAPGGECAWMYAIHAQDGTRYLLKLTQPGVCGDIITEQGQRAAWGLRHLCGIDGVIPAVRGRTGIFVYPLVDYAALLLPFVEGEVPRDAGLTESQQVALGQLLARIHLADLPPQYQPRRDDFGATLAEQLAQVIATAPASPSPAQTAMRDLLRQYQGVIQRVADDFESARQQVIHQPIDRVLCHSDPNSWNVIVQPGGDLALIDWDTPQYAPREHDLHYLQRHAAVMAGYQAVAGPVTLNADWISFYRRRWDVAEVVDYGWRTLLTRQSEAQYAHDVAALTEHLQAIASREDTP